MPLIGSPDDDICGADTADTADETLGVDVEATADAGTADSSFQGSFKAGMVGGDEDGENLLPLLPPGGVRLSALAALTVAAVAIPASVDVAADDPSTSSRLAAAPLGADELAPAAMALPSVTGALPAMASTASAPGGTALPLIAARPTVSGVAMRLSIAESGPDKGSSCGGPLLVAAIPIALVWGGEDEGGGRKSFL